MTDTKDIYGAFLTDSGSEKAGTWIDYGMVRVKVARAGGSNKQFGRILEAKTRPYQRAIKTETMDNIVAERIMREVFAEVIITGWETKLNDKWEKTVMFRDGTQGACVPASYTRVFEEIPDLFADIQEQAQKSANYRDAQREANAGN